MGAGEIERALERLYGRGATVSDEAAPTASERASEDDVRRLEDMASEAPIIRLVHDMIARAVEAQASDIHVEPREDCLRMRFRLDGMLHTVETLPLSLRAAVTSRIKIMANLEHRRAAPAAGRPHQDHRARARDRPARLDHADPVGRERRACASSTAPACSSISRRWALPGRRTRRSPSCSTSRTASSWSPARPAAARPPRSTRRSTRSTRPSARPSRSRTRSSTSWSASTRCRCSRRSA